MKRLTLLLLIVAGSARAGVGDPQVKTEHPWYPGELACSTFDRLFATQATLYQRVTGRVVASDQERALASWLWRNTHYWHGEEGYEDLWEQGFGKGLDVRGREYWTGQFAHGFGLCGTTHAQWVAEMEQLLGHGRGRSVGMTGHNSFEVFLRGDSYGSGRWALLDHDLSTVVFDPEGKRLLGAGELTRDWKRLTQRHYRPERQQGWLVCGLHPEDGASYARYSVAEYLSGYAGPPPMVYLRRGESLTRYFRPGLKDGKVFAYWGRNYRTGGIPGPERSRTWVNQPDAMFRSTKGTPHRDGQARHANAEYVYQPDFRTSDYREGVVSEDDRQITFEFTTPFIIAATPAGAGPWDIYQPGCRNGLVVAGKGGVAVSVSIDRGASWFDAGKLDGTLDLTDRVKGYRQYWLRLHASSARLRDSALKITTVCQASSAVMPHLVAHGSRVTFEASGSAVVSAGPNRAQAAPHIVAGGFDTPSVTLALHTPRGETVRAIHAAAHFHSGSPPDARVRYQIDSSRDGGKTWKPVVADWTVNRQGDEPRDFWSQSLCWGHARVEGSGPIQVRFRNSAGKRIARAEAHLVYAPRNLDRTCVTFGWTEGDGKRTHEHLVENDRATWTVPTGNRPMTDWVRFDPVPR